MVNRIHSPGNEKRSTKKDTRKPLYGKQPRRRGRARSRGRRQGEKKRAESYWKSGKKSSKKKDHSEGTGAGLVRRSSRRRVGTSVSEEKRELEECYYEKGHIYGKSQMRGSRIYKERVERRGGRGRRREKRKPRVFR